MKMERSLRNRNGQSFLALVFLIGAIVAIVGILVAFLANSFVDTGYGLSASSQAYSAAQSGVQDAIQQLTRNPSPPAQYNISVGSTTATVSISQDNPSFGYATVLSSATVSNRTRKVQAVLQENASTSQWSVISWQEAQ